MRLSFGLDQAVLAMPVLSLLLTMTVIVMFGMCSILDKSGDIEILSRLTIAYHGKNRR
jgi:hypothetical protein